MNAPRYPVDYAVALDAVLRVIDADRNCVCPDLTTKYEGDDVRPCAYHAQQLVLIVHTARRVKRQLRDDADRAVATTEDAG